MNRLKELRSLARTLKKTIKAAVETEDTKALAPLAKQYRETIREIEEIEGAADHDDELGDILAGRAADGKPGAVRKNRA